MITFDTWKGTLVQPFIIRPFTIRRKTYYGRVQIIPHKVKWKRFHHVMAYAANPNYTTYSSHFIWLYFLFEILITWQTQILLHLQFARNPNYNTFSSHFFSLRILITCQTQILLHFKFARNPSYTTFSNHYDLTCPRLIFDDSLILFIVINSWLIFLTRFKSLVILTFLSQNCNG